MNFKPDLVERIIAGDKTVTRRLANDNPRSPWSRAGCGLTVGRDYALCPGRGKPAVARIVIDRVELLELGELDDDEAQREGFPSAIDFAAVWERINGGYDAEALVWRVAFHLADGQPR